MANASYIEKNPEIIQKFTNAIYKGQKWVDEHTAKEIAQVCLPYFEDSNLELLTKIVERYKQQDTWKSDPVFSGEGFTLIQDIMEQGGELEQRIPFENFVDTTFAEKAIKDK